MLTHSNMSVIIMSTNKTEWTINQIIIKFIFIWKKIHRKFYSPAGYRDWETGEDIKKYHNDEKVMREVKFISGEDHRGTKVQQESK